MQYYVNQKDISGWEKDGCGIACICMVLGRAGKLYSYDSIIEEVTDMKGYIEHVGLKHTAIARILCNHGVPAYQQEFTHPHDTILRNIGTTKIQEQVSAGNPVIVSIMRHFDPNAPSTHLVLISGMQNNNFIIDDPDYESGSPAISVSPESFSNAWRGYTIFAELQRIPA